MKYSRYNTFVLFRKLFVELHDHDYSNSIVSTNQNSTTRISVATAVYATK